MRKVNGVNMDLNRQPTATDYDKDEEDEEDELVLRDSSLEDDGINTCSFLLGTVPFPSLTQSSK